MAKKKWTGYIHVEAPLKPSDLQAQLFNLVKSDTAMREAHRILGEMCEPYVPKDNGGLRASMKAYPSCVKWETPYAHYQYTGVVYGPNYPIIRKGIITRWYSTPGVKKKKTDREIGIPGEWKGWKFGYTTPGTGHHWFDEAMKGRGKNQYSIAVTRMLKTLAKKNGVP